jgi:phospholipid/cholesterol/gamma-HCH transport system ATP-binding protein
MVMLRFSGVACDKISDLSFMLGTGEIKVLRVPAREDKISVMELVAGEKIQDQGSIELLGAPLTATSGGSIAWMPEQGGLISNLKAWENATLPLWYHGRRRVSSVDEKARHWLAALGVAESDMKQLMGSPADRLRPLERKLIGLLRCLLQEPQLLVLEAAVFNGIKQDRRETWVETLEAFVRMEEQRAVLVVADGDNLLPWGMVAQE